MCKRRGQLKWRLGEARRIQIESSVCELLTAIASTLHLINQLSQVRHNDYAPMLLLFIIPLSNIVYLLMVYFFSREIAGHAKNGAAQDLVGFAKLNMKLSKDAVQLLIKL